METLRTMTPKGNEYLETLIGQLRRGEIEDLPRDELNQAPMSAPFGDVTVEDRQFETRYEMGQYLVHIVRDFERRVLLNNPGLWNWLAVFWFDQLAPKRNGSRVVRETARYVYTPGYRKYYRHLVLTSWDLCSQHGELSRPLLHTSPDTLSDLLEQVASRQNVVASNAIMRVVYSLYWDPERERPKPHAADRNYRGNVRRLITVLDQFHRTFDLYSMAASEIIELLPKEFGGWVELGEVGS